MQPQIVVLNSATESTMFDPHGRGSQLRARLPGLPHPSAEKLSLVESLYVGSAVHSSTAYGQLFASPCGEFPGNKLELLPKASLMVTHFF